MVINVLDLVPHCYTWEDGQVVAKRIKDVLKSRQVATISFAGVGDIPTSFANGAFVSLLDEYDYDFIRKNVLVVNSTRQINEMIKRRLTFVSEGKKRENKLVTS
jgi:predicted metallo-beta-lactamase superfamily hydrolase